MTDLKLPRPSDITQREKERAMAAYLTMFATTAFGLPLPFLNLIAAWIYHHYTKRTSPFVSFHSYQSLILQFVISGLNGVVVGWAVYSFFTQNFTELFFAFLISTGIANLFYLIFSIVAAVKAYKGKMFYFFFFGKVAFIRGYKSYEEKKEMDINKAPV
jgi:uncharacterized Tic20 family protein